MRNVTFCVNSDHKAIVCCAQIHYTWRTTREQVRCVKKCKCHTKRGKQYGPLKRRRHKIRNSKCRLATNVHWPVVYQEVIHHTKDGGTAQTSEHKSRET